MFRFSLIYILIASVKELWVAGGIPADPKYHMQIVDHLNPNSPYADLIWRQRYYILDDHFQGPGSPIFLILGGEGAIEPTTGLMYPFVADTLASKFGAVVLQPEHRFYGHSQPISSAEIAKARSHGLPDPRVDLLTSEQAIHDAIELTSYLRSHLQCSKDRFSHNYCPVISVGGSYPGFLAAFARIGFPEVFDMAYAASAPMKFYAQKVASNAYYDHIASVAESASSGCPSAVKRTLDESFKFIQSKWTDPALASEATGICPGTLAEYVTNINILLDEILMMVGYTFSNNNMGYYPPVKDTALYRGCQIFQSTNSSAVDRLRSFLVKSLHHGTSSERSCFDMNQQLPAGPNATVSGGDWSGVGSGVSGDSWDFQTCTLLIERIGFDKSSGMFPEREWSIDWLTDHCQSRYGVVPRPFVMNQKWHIDNIVEAGASRILFTNGEQDGWSVSGMKDNMTDTLLAINFESGAHHSDLNHRLPSSADTDDLIRGFSQIREILSTWLSELPGGRLSARASGIRGATTANFSRSEDYN